MYFLFAPIVALLLFVGTAYATHVSYDPYADAVQSNSPIGVVDPQNSVGAPDGNTTTIAGINRFIVLDMGNGEEGTGTLRVHLGNIIAQANLQVIFLDGDLGEITSESRQLAISTQTSTQDFAYSFASFNKAYRYVRLTALAEAGIALDAIEALDYIGETDSTDTDEDGTADQDEQHNGRDPQVDDAPAAPGGAGGDETQEGAPAEQTALAGAAGGVWDTIVSWWNAFTDWAKDFFCTNWWIAPLLILLAAAAGIWYGVSRMAHRRRSTPPTVS
ncbi:hypothetical protein A2797_02710 [candidate division WWE3 bacterium RIFCSPHIGHO2_01_FULL_48_15]|uniref:Uncharacterized protein n=1 Tax=candidate division WWE3 bacterium RIFCSPHIGHO2_01_FULL_48_15 TaxID=1802619 RepID=A0A1F4VFI7_UNCKA|nr:MAG: hypothetical protein A2797_02710 [candidate division WWE3 bacterium RIFCSPHIGHO2_01_FULL_48_15]